MKQAVISTGGKQYLVQEGDILDIELIADKKSIDFVPLLVHDEKTTKVGKPEVAGAKVSAKILDNTKDGKVTSIRFKSKKRVHKTRGHRQNHTRIEITKIS